MVNLSDVEDILFAHNFVWDGIITENSGTYTFYYYYLLNANELSSATGYDTNTTDSDGAATIDEILPNIEYSTFSATTVNQQALFAWALNGGTQSVVFTDVVDNLTFSAAGSATAADINIGQVVWDSGDGNPNDDDANVPAYEIDMLNKAANGTGIPYSTSYFTKAHGDIWLNSNLNAGWDNLNLGEGQAYLILHELGHALGLKGDNSLIGSPIDNQKYTIMSYKAMSEMVPFLGSVFFPTGLQLFDILAIQNIFESRNYNTRSTNTTYTIENMNPSLDDNTAFLYTIWDGDGVDTIDLSTMTYAAQIDLRQGKFSSIGYDAWAGVINFDKYATIADPDPGNVAIAYYTVIEDAIGTYLSDIIVGNAWDNTLNGGDGRDYIYGDGIVYDNDAGFHEEDENRPGPEADGNDSGVDELYGGDGDDHLFGGMGNDKLYGGNDNDQVDGGGDNDTLFGGAGYDYLYGGEGYDVADYSSTDAYLKILQVPGEDGMYTVDKYFGQTSATGAYERDYLFSIEEIKGNPANGAATNGAGGKVINGNEESNSLAIPSGDDYAISLYGKEEDDLLYGWNHDDYLDGGEGNDYVSGNDGDDTYIYRRGDGNDFITDILGTPGDIDTLIMQGISSSEVTLHRHYYAIKNVHNSQLMSAYVLAR